jgi:uncharacterized SAM-binding protein YcdF (DUF218 family)
MSNDLSSCEAKRIAEFLDLEARPRQADLVFTFGTWHPDPARIAADLFTRGMGRYVVITGGENRSTGINEAQAHLNILTASAIPRDRIIVEDCSTNTLENVRFALPRIAQKVKIESIRAIVAVTKWYHCRRAVMTLKRDLPQGIRYYAETYEPEGIARVNWHLHPEGTRRVLKEWESIRRYLAQGDIAQVCRDKDAFV